MTGFKIASIIIDNDRVSFFFILLVFNYSLLAQNLKFEVCASNFEENLDPAKYKFDEFVQQTALGKVNDVYERLKDDATKPDIVIGADTMVVHQEKIFGKPHTKQEAYQVIKK